MPEVLEPVEVEEDVELERRWMVVYFPAASERQIKPGRHAECKSLEEAVEQVERCKKWFNRELVSLPEGKIEWRPKVKVEVQIDYWENGRPVQKNVGIESPPK